MSDRIVLSGRCLCGAIRYRFEGVPLWTSHCHCESCRRQTSAVFASFVGMASGDVTWHGEARRQYRSSPDVIRTFCGNCGSPMTYESDTRVPGETHVHVGTLDDPNALPVGVHVFIEEQLNWLDVADHLPRFRGSDIRNQPPLRIGPRPSIEESGTKS